MFKEVGKDEYTLEELPMGPARLAMKEELEYFCDKVWAEVPITEPKLIPMGRSLARGGLTAARMT